MKKIITLFVLCVLGTVSAAAAPGLAKAQGQYLDSSIGVDIGYPNGSISIPSVSFGIVGVTRGLIYSNNEFLASQVSNFSNLSLYVNTGLNASSLSQHYQQAQVGCYDDANCAAYNYGHNAGIAAIQYAQLQSINTHTAWWLDVEAANSWTKDFAQNKQSLQGEIDALNASGATMVGIYSTATQWNDITGGWKNNLPSWGATTFTTSKQALTYCTGHQFTGGTSYLMQYRPKGSKTDYDVACPTSTGGTDTKPGGGHKK